jgi:hypothetical protein
MMRWLIACIIGALLVLAALAADGDATNYNAERTQRTAIEQAGQTERTAIQQDGQTQRTQIAEAGQTERTYIGAQQLMWLATEREATLRLVILLLLVIVASCGSVVVVVLVMRRVIPLAPSSPTPPPHAQQLVRRMSAGHRLEYDHDHGWIVVLPSRSEYYTLDDAQRLLEQRL